MKFRYKIEYALVKSLNALLFLLPRNGIYRLYQGFAFLFFHLAKSRRQLTLKNLEIAFPEKTPSERLALAKSTYRNIAHSMAYNALLMSNRISPEEMMRTVEFSTNNLENFLTLQGSGAIIFTAHIGNWELLPQIFSRVSEQKLNMIARELDNPLLEHHLIRPFRERGGAHVIYKNKAMIGTVKALKRGEIVGILIDQKASPQDGALLTNFFGRETFSLATSAQLQIKLGIPVIPVYNAWTVDGQYKIMVGAPIEWKDNGAPQAEQIKALTQIHHQAIEKMIRAYPDQWFWMHNRWKLNKEEYR